MYARTWDVITLEMSIQESIMNVNFLMVKAVNLFIPRPNRSWKDQSACDCSRELDGHQPRSCMGWVGNYWPSYYARQFTRQRCSHFWYTLRWRRSYRTTREIMDFATLLYRQRLADEKDDDILAPVLLNMPNGTFPQIIPLTSPQDEIIRIANEVADFLRKGYLKKHLLVLHTDGAKDLIRAIEDRLGKVLPSGPRRLTQVGPQSCFLFKCLNPDHRLFVFVKEGSCPSCRSQWIMRQCKTA